MICTSNNASNLLNCIFDVAAGSFYIDFLCILGFVLCVFCNIHVTFYCLNLMYMFPVITIILSNLCSLIVVLVETYFTQSFVLFYTFFVLHRHCCFQTAFLCAVFLQILFLFFKSKADQLLLYYLSLIFWCCFLHYLTCDLSVSMFPAIHRCLSRWFRIDLEFESVNIGVADVLGLGLLELLGLHVPSAESSFLF